MRVKAFIHLVNSPWVESLATGPGLVSRHTQHNLAFWIKGERHLPPAVCSTEQEFLHGRVVPVLERAHSGTPNLRSQVLHEPR